MSFQEYWSAAEGNLGNIAVKNHPLHHLGRHYHFQDQGSLKSSSRIKSSSPYPFTNPELLFDLGISNSSNRIKVINLLSFTKYTFNFYIVIIVVVISLGFFLGRLCFFFWRAANKCHLNRHRLVNIVIPFFLDEVLEEFSTGFQNVFLIRFCFHNS